MPELRLRREKTKRVNYAKWGYFFILPFFIIYAIFSFYPLLYTLYISFFENHRTGLKTIGPNFIGIENYAKIFQDGKYMMQIDSLEKNVEREIPLMSKVLESTGAGVIGTIGTVAIAPTLGVALIPGIILFGGSYFAIKSFLEKYKG